MQGHVVFKLHTNLNATACWQLRRKPGCQWVRMRAKPTAAEPVLRQLRPCIWGLPLLLLLRVGLEEGAQAQEYGCVGQVQPPLD